MQPDLVIVNQEENRREDAEALQAAGIPVWVTFPRTVREAFNLLWSIMDVFDEPRMVERVRVDGMDVRLAGTDRARAAVQGFCADLVSIR